jgi:haloalkane dehalogenase
MRMTTNTTIARLPYVEQRIPREGHTLYVRDYPGVGPAFVLMHGFPDNLRIYDFLAPLLAEAGRRVISFDFLGYGASDKPRGHAYTAQGMEGDLDAVVSALQVDVCIPVAHDASGPTAINWALDHQSHVSALALLNTYYDAAPTLRFPELISLFSDPAYADLAAAFLAAPAQFGWLLQFQAGQFQRDAPLELRGRAQILMGIIESQFGAPPNAGPAFMGLTRDLHATVDDNTLRAAALSRFGRPVRLIWGAGDPYLNRGVGEHLRDLFPTSELDLLPFGHWPQLDGPERVAECLLSIRGDE